MRPLLQDVLRPAAFRRGRGAAAICLVYLLLVFAAAGFAVYDALFVESIGASFAALPLIVLTAPLSFVAVPAVSMVAAMIFANGNGVAATAVSVVLTVALGLVQAFLGWLVLRGPRKTADGQ